MTSPMNSPINTTKLEKSVSALLKWKKIQKHSESGDNFLYLIITLKKVVAKPLQSIPHRIPLPNPLHPLPATCLIIPDPSPKSPHKLTVEAALKKIKSENIAISNVFKLAKVRALCGSIDSRLKFLESYEVVLVDERVYESVRGVLGKEFCRKGVLVPVGLKGRMGSGVGWREEVEEACRCQVLRFGSGSCRSVRVGGSWMGRGEIVENVGAAISEVVEVVPKKWRGVAAVHLKFCESLAMPVYRKDERSVSGNEEAGDGGKVETRSC